jgi:DNA-binding response OmpR family regulator
MFIAAARRRYATSSSKLARKLPASSSSIWEGRPMQSTNDILVIDDDAPIVDMTVEVLQYEGFSVRSACDSASALMAIAAQHPALILLDWTMSSDGTTLFEKLRSQAHDEVPIVIISAALRIKESVLARGAADFLAKPFDLDDLLTCVTRYVPRPQPLTQ